MRRSDREGVLASARYLRQVRPVDPAEVADYVEGQPHPAAVRQVLREEALALGLVERADGTFVPAPEGPFEPAFDGVPGLPEPYARRVEDMLVGRFGPDWHRGESGDRLRETVRRLKADYYHQHPVEYDAEAALAYAVYHLPGYYAATQYAVDVVAREGLLDRRLRVLDVGAGVGGPALGLHDYLFGRPGDPGRGADAGPAAGGEGAETDGPPTPPALVDYHAVEPSAAADVLAELLDETGPNFHPTVHRTTAEAFDPETVAGDADGEAEDGGDADGGGDDADGDAGAGFDLVLFCNVLAELDDPVAVVERYARSVVPDGTVLATAPADRHTSRHLRSVERAVENGLTVFAPAVRLWPGERPTADCWSFDRAPDLAVPAFQARLAADADDPGAFRNPTVKLSYSVLRRDGRRRIAATGDPGRHARMADADDHVTGRVDLLAAKLSGDLSEADNPVFLVSDGSERETHYAVLVRETALNGALVRAGYGDVLSVEGALVLWNDDEGAYNLVVDDETVVDAAVPVGRPPDGGRDR